MSSLVIILTILYTQIAFSAEKSLLAQVPEKIYCPNKVNSEQVLDLFKNIIETDIPQLKQFYDRGQIKYEEFEGEEYFLGTFPKLSNAFKKNPTKRKAKLKVNKSIFKCAPSENALRAILIHEAKHLLDYFTLNFAGYLKLLNSYSDNHRRAKYERSTDLYVLETGYHKGLKEYRDWIYLRLNPKELKTKQCFYLTSQEISQWKPTQEINWKETLTKYCGKKKKFHPKKRY